MSAKTEKPTGLALLRMPFPDNLISKLPKETKAQIDERKANKNAMVFNCPVCGGHHHKNAVHLDYVGHAALTDRLLDADPHWNWEPYVAPGLPNPGNGMWIKLNVCGQSQIGYGHADGKSGGDAIKEIIGDAMRNAAMRFGAALDLWHKGDLHADDADEPKPENKPRQKPADLGGITGEQLDQIKALIGLQRKHTVVSIIKAYQSNGWQGKDFDDFSERDGAAIIRRLQATIDEERIAKSHDDIGDDVPY